jgi:hypothetical protein
MKTDKEFLQEARDFQRATVKAVSTLIRGTPDLLKMLDLRGADFRGADLRDVDFSAALLTGSIFHNADLENAQFQGADLSGSEFDDETDELASVKALSATLIRNVADRDKEIAALSKNDAVLKDSIARINSLHGIIEARDKEIAELKDTFPRRSSEFQSIRENETRLGRELAEANREIQRLTLVVAELSRRDRIQIDTIGQLEKDVGRLIAARDKIGEALDSKDELIAELRDAQNRPGFHRRPAMDPFGFNQIVNPPPKDVKPRPAAARGTIRIEIVRSVDPASKTTAQIVGRIYDADGAHYSPGFGVKAVVVGRSGSDVLREMSENWSRAGFME